MVKIATHIIDVAGTPVLASDVVGVVLGVVGVVGAGVVVGGATATTVVFGVW